MAIDEFVNGLSEDVLRPLLGNLLSAMDGILWTADADGRYGYISPGIEQLLGYPTASWLENPHFWQNCLHPDDRAWVVEHCQSHMTDNRPYQIEYRVLARNGRLIWIHESAVPTNDPDNPIIGVKQNITEEKTLALLHQIAGNIGATLDHREILRISLRQLKHVFVFDSSSIYLNPFGNQIEFIAGMGFADNEITSYSAQNLLVESPILHDMANDLRPFISGDVRQLSNWIWVEGAEHVRSFLAVPLISRDQMIGVLMADSRKTDYFVPEDLPIFETLARHIAISVEKAWLYEETQQQLQLAQTLQQVGSLLTTSLGLNEVYERIFDLLAKVVAYDSVSIQLIDHEGKDIALAAGRGFPDFELARSVVNNMGTSSLSRFSQDNVVKVIPDTLNDDQWINVPEGIYIRSWIGALLQVKGEIIGVLNVDGSRPNAYTEADGHLVSAFANQAAVAIANAQLYEETRLRADELAVLHRVAMATASAVDVDELLRIATETIAKSLYPEMFGFVLVDEATGIMTPHPSYHGIKEEMYDIKIPAHSVTGLVVQTGKPFKSGDVSQEKLYFSAVSATRSEIAVPFKVNENVLGVINVESSRLNAFTDNDTRFLNTLAAQVALAFERASLYRELQLHAADLADQVSARTAELKVERDRTLEILESAGEAILMTDKDTRIQYVNPAFEQQSGYLKEELIGLQPSVLSSEHTPPATFEEMMAAIQAGNRWSGEFVNRRKDGNLYEVAATITPLRNAQGRLSGYVSTQSDITRLKELDRLKSKFVSTVSHELRTPLTGIKMYLTLLEKGKAERKAQYLHVLNHETDRLASLIEDLLDLSRLDTEDLPDGTAVTDVKLNIQRQFNLFSAKASAKNILFRLEVADGLPLARIADKHLDQLLTNLLGNSFAYTPISGTVILAVRFVPEDGRSGIEIVVSDTGPGIPKDEMDNLFTRFFRGKLTQELGVPGTGLGLAICQEILLRYNGRISVNSTVGQGSQFTVWIPAVSKK